MIPGLFEKRIFLASRSNGFFFSYTPSIGKIIYFTLLFISIITFLYGSLFFLLFLFSFSYFLVLITIIFNFLQTPNHTISYVALTYIHTYISVLRIFFFNSWSLLSQNLPFSYSNLNWLPIRPFAQLAFLSLISWIRSTVLWIPNLPFSWLMPLFCWRTSSSSFPRKYIWEVDFLSSYISKKKILFHCHTW